jgi:hypothetical protein
MGRAWQAAQDDPTKIPAYNDMAKKWNAGLKQYLGDDPLVKELWMTPMQPTVKLVALQEGRPNSAEPIINSTGQREHRIDGGQSDPMGPQPDAEGRIHGMPAGAYFTMFPDATDLSHGNLGGA